MKHKVLKRFQESGKIFEPGSFYESTDNQRIKLLDEKGFVKANKEEKPKSKTRKKASE